MDPAPQLACVASVSSRVIARNLERNRAEPLATQATPQLTVDAIDLMLRQAQVCNAQLQCIHYLLNQDPNAENEEWRRKMATNTALIFRDMVSYLYSVLDSVFYFLYCHFQNNGTVSYTSASCNINQPIAQKLQYSQNIGRDASCKDKRNEQVEKWCEAIFGADYYNKIELAKIRRFQKNLLSIQVITEVSGNGDAVLDDTGDVILRRACNIQLEERQAVPFNPTSVEFKLLPSVQNINNWNEAMILNLLHFFRNFTTHRTVIECKEMRGHLNLDTMEYMPSERESSDTTKLQWIVIKEGSWIKVPELRHLRQKQRSYPITFYNFPVVSVCHKFFRFVQGQRDRLLAIVGGFEGSNVSNEISFDWHGSPKVKINGQFKKWYNARYDTSV